MKERREPISDQELDELLTQARWPNASSESSQRLQDRWGELTARRTLRPTIWRSVSAAAAMLAVAIGIVWIVLDRFEKTRTVANSTTETTANSPTPERGVTPTRSMRVIGREPNLIELAYMRKFEKKASAATKPSNHPPSAPFPSGSVPSAPVVVATAPAPAPAPAPQTKPVVTAAQRIARTLDRPTPIVIHKYLMMVMDPQTKRDALAALDQMKRPPTDQLLAVLSSPRVDLREAAALALGRIDGPATTRKLITLIEADQSRREAFLALASSRGPEAQAFVRRAAMTEQLASYAQSAMAQTEIR